MPDENDAQPRAGYPFAVSGDVYPAAVAMQRLVNSAISQTTYPPKVESGDGRVDPGR